MSYLKLKTLFLCLICLITTSCSKAAEKSESDNNLITVSTYAKNEYLEAAAKQFMNEHPGINIDIITFAPEIDSDVLSTNYIYEQSTEQSSPERYVKNINTALMSQKGSDIINMDVLSFQKYASEGYLANLETFIKNDSEFNTDDYYNGIFEALKYNDGLYIMPIDYILYITRINSDYSYSTDKFYKISDVIKQGMDELSKHKNAGVWLYRDKYSLFRILYEENKNLFYGYGNEESNFNSKDFIDILNLSNKAFDIGFIPKNESEVSEDNLYYFEYDSIWTQNLLMPYFGFGNEYKNPLPVTDNNGNIYFTCPHAFAINENSENKQLSWEFIKFLVSEQAQSTPGNFPINKRALKNGYTNQILQILNDAVDNGMTLSDDAEKITSDYIKTIETWSELASVYMYMDVTIENIIKLETSAFFDGTQTADDTAKNINDKVNTYLKESQ